MQVSRDLQELAKNRLVDNHPARMKEGLAH